MRRKYLQETKIGFEAIIHIQHLIITILCVYGASIDDNRYTHVQNTMPKPMLGIRSIGDYYMS